MSDDELDEFEQQRFLRRHNIVPPKDGSSHDGSPTPPEGAGNGNGVHFTDDGEKIRLGKSSPPSDSPSAPPPAAPSGVSFLQQYFIPPEETNWASLAENFRKADTKRFALKVGAVGLGGIALADGCWLAAHKDDNNNRHPLKGLCIGAAGALGLVAGLMMRGNPLSR